MKTRTLPLLALLASLTTLTACIPLVVAGVGGGVASTLDRRTYAVQLQDQEIELRVTRAINRQFDGKVNISTTSVNRRVLLSGQASTESFRAEAEKIARSTPNVVEVYNEVTIGWPAGFFSTGANDRLITSKVKGRLFDPDAKGVSGHHVKVVTESSVVFLMGMLGKAEAEAAVEIARTTSGVKKVVNLFEILSDAEVQRLNEALKATNPPESQR